MADHRLRTEWRQTASLMALMCELQRDRKKRRKSFSADDFDPFAERREACVTLTKEQFRSWGAATLGKSSGK